MDLGTLRSELQNRDTIESIQTLKGGDLLVHKTDEHISYRIERSGDAVDVVQIDTTGGGRIGMVTFDEDDISGIVGHISSI